MNVSGGLRTYAAQDPERRIPGKSTPLDRQSRRDTPHALLSTREDGNALVEFALVAPIMLMIMMGIVAIGSTMSNYLQLIEATSSAARGVAVARSNTLDPCNSFSSAVISGAPLLNSSNMAFTLVLASSQRDHSWNIRSDYRFTYVQQRQLHLRGAFLSAAGGKRQRNRDLSL